MCKFYQGAEDKELENQLKKMFAVVHKDKPKSSRSVGISLGGLGVKLTLLGI